MQILVILQQVCLKVTGSTEINWTPVLTAGKTIIRMIYFIHNHMKIYLKTTICHQFHRRAFY